MKYRVWYNQPRECPTGEKALSDLSCSWLIFSFFSYSGNPLIFLVACNLNFDCSCTLVKKNSNITMKKKVTKSPQRSSLDLPVTA